MKKCIFIATFALVMIYNAAFSQCGRISLIGEFNGWIGDSYLTRDPVDPDEFSTIIILTIEDDTDQDGFVSMKFRENSDWMNNWGSTQFPSGTAILNGPNIPAPVGSYLVTFNCSSLHYNFQATCGEIGLIGEMNVWSSDEWMTRDLANPDHWSSILNLDAASDANGDGIVEMKFRENGNWSVNWGSDDFPAGIGGLSGSNIPVPLTSSGITTDYRIMFNCETAAYNFTETCGQVSLIGEFTGWADDFNLERDPILPHKFTGLLTITSEDDPDGDGDVEMKFRENADWNINWGYAQFPSGTAMLNGPNIPVPFDNTGITTDYIVTFNCSTLTYSFEATSGPVSIIGAFTGWSGDIPMNRDPGSADVWKLTRCWWENSDIKFRENRDWQMNWGNDEWPSGTGEWNGMNIPLIAGTYDVTFNVLTLAYNFVSNPDVCGEIGLVGDFNEWGAGNPPTDLWMLRDPVYPSQFSLDYYFSENTGLLFRRNADPTLTDVWGGNSICQTGEQNSEEIIDITSGTYHITFDCNSGDYCFTYIGNSVIATNVFMMNIDGYLDESYWEIDQPVAKLIEGLEGEDPNEVFFGAAYNDSYLYLGVKVFDEYITANDAIDFFVDVDNSGGPYEYNDVHFRCVGSDVEIITGPPGGNGIQVSLFVFPASNGYTMEVAIPWEDLGITPIEGKIAGFDIILSDDEDGYPPAESKLAWNGNLENDYTTDNFGDLILGSSVCGNMSLFNQNLGDIPIQRLTDDPSTYVATYEFDNNFDVVFRKDKSAYMSWGSDDFPEGTAEEGGPAIPAVEGRYRLSYNCESSAYSFVLAPAGASVAAAHFTEDIPEIDGMLDEYDLDYHSDTLVMGDGPLNNTVNWGARWDLDNIYLGVQVTDQALFGSGNPWENDGIEFFIDGNNDKDGVYDPGFDTHIIMDALNLSLPWIMPDGVPVTDYDAEWIFTSLGYNVELRLGWDNFSFEPGKGRNIGFSLANNDNDNNIGVENQSTWFGTANNWNNTSFLGEVQLAEGPYTVNVPELISEVDFIVYPNPGSGNFNLAITGQKSESPVQIIVTDLSGKSILIRDARITSGNCIVPLDLESVKAGIYLVQMITSDGERLVRKLMIF